MKRVILFRYHKEFEVCEQNIRLLRRLNPECPIIGLFGGEANNAPPLSLTELLDDNYVLPFEDWFYKWRNGDLCVLNWFEKVGQKLDFDVVNLIEWDLALLKPIDEIYRTAGDGFGVGKIFGYDYAKKIDWPWLFSHKERPLWLKQMESVKDVSKPIDETKMEFFVFGGIQIPRSFLEKYQEEQPRPFINDEPRVSLYAYLWNYKLINVGLESNPANLYTADPGLYDSLTDEKIVSIIRNGAEVIHPARTLQVFETIFEILDQNSGSIN